MKKTIAKLHKGEHVKIVAFGDSNTENTFHTHGRMNWVSLLDEAIFETYGHGVCTVVNSGKCGSSYQEGLTRLDRDVLCFNPDLVIIAFGMNEAGLGMKGLESFKHDVKTTVKRIRETCGSEILIRTPNPIVAEPGGPYPLGKGPGDAYDPENRPLKEYSAVLVGLAKELNCEIVDHYAMWTGEKFTVKKPVANPCGLWPRMADRMHPNWLGHLVFYRELAPKLNLPKYFPWEGVNF
jgi:lysophospholipase L1-like esterase